MLLHVIVVCDCSHLKREHIVTKQQPNGPCTTCCCLVFEKAVRHTEVRHGSKAHRKGRCHECGCTQFRPKP